MFHLVDLLKFKLDQPGAKEHPLWFELSLVFLIESQDALKILLKMALLVL